MTYSHPKLTQTIKKKFIELSKEDVGQAKEFLARSLGVKKSQKNEWAKRIWKEAGLPVTPVVQQRESGELPPEKSAAKADFVGNAGVAESVDENVKTLEDLLRVCQVDLNIWEVERYILNKWATARGAKDGGVKVQPLYQVKAWLRKKEGAFAKLDLAALKDEMKSYSPIVQKIHRGTADNNASLLQITIFDAHLGKLSWAIESHDDYDLKIAKKVYMEALYDLVAKALMNGPIARIVYPIGNDFLTCDNQNLTTTALTPQSVDSRFPKIFKEGRELLVESINYLKQIAPVDVIVVVGNHDSNSMYHIGDALECWFHADENVTINNTPTPRKYYRYGQNLLCYAHGDKINHKKLPLLAAVECKDWSNCRYREWYVGHLHHERVTEENGVKTRIIPSITGSDEYHNSHGYIGSIRTSQAFLYDADTGLKTILYSKPVEG